jgi:hypothetical protein
MDDEKNEILNALQNGFFNEGIYRISQEIPAIIEIAKPTPAIKEETVELIPAEPVTLAEEAAIVPSVISETKKTEPEQIISLIPEFSGGNKKGVAILVSYRDERWIYFKDKIILEKILESVKLKLDDVALINTYYLKSTTVDEFTALLGISKIIGFGIHDPFLKSFKRDEPQKTSNTSVFLMNADLQEIAMDVNKKRLLWNNLKIMFNIK